MNKLKLSHPGRLLLREFIKPFGLTQYRVAKDAGIAHSSMTALVKGQRAITVETAMRLGLYFGTTPEFWLNLQARYDLRRAQKERLPKLVREVQPLALA
ncbi:MAG: HigA family addiction module antidote protein [Verrucomicrobia bacterium]|nr:HigA family addiction module antidote protein [Verrucomicrobiota bacterium]